MYNISKSVYVNSVNIIKMRGLMINKKMHLLGRERSVIREIFEYGRKRKSEIGENAVFDFSLGNPSVPAPAEVNREIRRLLDTERDTVLHGYTSAAGAPEVREAIANYITSKHCFKTSSDFIYITVGAAAALTSTLTAITNEGDEVIVIAPYFPEYKVFIERCGAKTVSVMADCDFQPDIAAIENAINEKTAAIIINSPNNPTGAVITEEKIKALADMLTKKSREIGHTVYLVADEPYRELAYGVSVPYIPCYYKNTIVCYSYSKSLSLPGERIGYVAVSPEADYARDVYLAILGAGRALGYVCAPSLMQRILPALMGASADVELYNQNRILLYNALTNMGYTAVKPDGAFYMFVKSPSGDAGELCERAKRHELLIVPSDSFGCGGYARISYCVAREEIERALPAFAALAESYGLKGRKND